jgi:hypothetical protein
MMEQDNANRPWRPAASFDRPTPARTLIGRRGQRRRSAGFQTCCIADFQIGRVSQFGGIVKPWQIEGPSNLIKPDQTKKNLFRKHQAEG